MTTQTDTKGTALAQGLRKINAGEDLTGLEGRLVKLADAGSEPEVLRPSAVTDICPFLVVREAAHDADCEVLPILGPGNFRVRLNGTVAAGTRVVLCDPDASSGANRGKVETLPAAAGLYYSPGIAEEDGVDEQLVLVRPAPALVHVPTAFTGASPADTAATSSTPYGFAQAQADALVANVREIRAALITHGLMAANA